MKSAEQRRSQRAEKFGLLYKRMYRSPTMHQPRMRINGCDRWRTEARRNEENSERTFPPGESSRGGLGGGQRRRPGPAPTVVHANASWATRGGTNHLTHPPLSQGAQRRAEGEGHLSRSALARGELGGGGLFLRGLGRTGAGLDVEVLQDVVVDFRGDPLLLQHLPDGLVGGVGADGRALPRGSLRLQGTKPEL